MTMAVEQLEAAHVTLEPAFLTRVRLRAHRRALWLKALWSAEAPPGHLAITPEEVQRHLAGPGLVAATERHFYDTDPQARELGVRIEAAEEGAEDHERWKRLCNVFGLSTAESDLMSLAVAVSADPAFARVCGYLHDDASACYATPLLAAAIFAWPSVVVPGTASGLMRWRLARVSEGASHPSAPSAPWIADAFIVAWLLGEEGLDPVIGTAAYRLASSDAACLECLYPETLRSMAGFLSAMRQSSTAAPVEIGLSGPRGGGKRVLAAQLCAPFGADLLVVDLEALLTGEPSLSSAVERISHAVRQTWLDGAVPYWNHAHLLEPRLRQMLEEQAGLAFFAGDAPMRTFPSQRSPRQSFEIGALTQVQRLQLWRQLTPEPMPEPLRDWQLTPAELHAAAQVAPAGVEATLHVARGILHNEPGELFSALPLPYTWDDIVLTPDISRQLGELAAQARLRGAVLEDWGFDRLCRMGRGINALFAGPSGTGKTMAAQVLARDLGRELCRVDLAEVVNKYIGETEKRLKRVFEICERAPVVLFFDEADALFGQRTQVKDAHDRYANIQIDYLLQRMEQFDGVAILSTNRKNDLDSAFLRRLRFIVDFVAPGPAERLKLWRLSLAERSPSGEELLREIAWQWLADNLILTGAEIKAIALAAAFLARSEGSPIRMDHLEHAARREMTKQGASWRAGKWSGAPNA
jgi:AAA+ superfamily predicted ATPase